MRSRVWAPAAGQVEVVIAGRRSPMTAEDGGWWSGPEIGFETDYAFSIDGGPPRPDPRGERSPQGVHGPSRRVDHDAFEWQDAGFGPTPLAEGVVYELHVGTFSERGTFEGAIEHLDGLVELGISHVEVMPVHAFPGRRGWGYDVAGFFAVQEAYGGPEGLKRFVDACHGRGLAVILDVVYNHLGPEGCYLPAYGPYVTDRFRTPWGGAVNLGDAGADEVRRFIIDNALLWLRDYHVDGLRLDAVHAFIDLTATHLLEELAIAVDGLARQLDRSLVLIAESDLNDPRVLRSRELGGYGIDGQWSDDYHHALHTMLSGERDGYYEDFDGLADVVRALRRGWVYEGRYSRHRGRRHGRSSDGLALERMLGYAQNHDQVGNRARGERLSQLVDPRALKVAAGLVVCGPFVPLLFQGEEWGASTPFLFFADFEDEALGEAVRTGRRREFAAFGWEPEDVPDPLSEATFERSRLDRHELGVEPHAGLLEWHRALIRLRRATSGPQSGTRPRVQADSEAGWLVAAVGARTVAANVSRSLRSVPVEPELAVALASDPAVSIDSGRLLLPAMSLAVLTEPPMTGTRGSR
ncbi:MAG: malto-oligosyltrehalose trehalohydrolase [Candidatus Limnocylindrales bacterium]